MKITKKQLYEMVKAEVVKENFGADRKLNNLLNQKEYSLKAYEDLKKAYKFNPDPILKKMIFMSKNKLAELDREIIEMEKRAYK